MLSLQEKIIKGSFAVIILSLLGSVCAYLIRILLSRTLSIENYGLFYAVLSFFSIISVHIDLGFGEAITYFVPKYLKSKRYKELWNTFIYGQVIQIVVSVLISVVLIIVAPYLSSRYFRIVGSETLIYIFCAFLIINSLLNSLSQIFTGLQKIKYYSSINILRTALVLFFSSFFLIIGLNGPIFYALSWVFGYFLTTILFLYLLWSKHPLLTENILSWNKNIFNTMYKYALPAFATTLVYSLLVSSDTFLLTLLRGVIEVGIYNVIVPIASISIIFLSPLNLILFPLVSTLMEEEGEKINYLVSKIYQLVPFVGIYFALFIILFPSSIVSLIFGQKWLDFSIIPLSILSLGYIGIIMSSILGSIILGTGRVKERLKILVVVAVLNVSLNVILIWYYGILGAVISSSLVAVILCIFFTRIIKTTANFQIPYLFYGKLSLFSVFLFFIIRLIGFAPKNWTELILSGVVYTTVFVILGFLFKIYDKKVIELILPRKNYKL